MKTSRPSRILTAIAAIFSMLFMQLAVAMYACPGMPTGGQDGAMQASVVAVDMANCEGMDKSQPSLCHIHAHGELSKQSLEKSPVPDVPPFVAGTLVLDLQFFDVAALPETKPYPPVTLTRSTAPPISIRNCCFRI